MIHEDSLCSRLVLLAALFFSTAVYSNSLPYPLPDAESLNQARSIIEAMKENERGPYARLRWFCNDGTVHPPQPYACKERGGGQQHAEYSESRQKLAELGFHVGTIYSSLEWERFRDVANRHQRMRELALEKFMFDIDDGWVLRKAKNYRGRIQIEDEIEAGRTLLLRLLENPEWVTENFLLLKELVKVVPHHSGKDLTRNIRRHSTELAELVPSFENIRIEIHTQPSKATIPLIDTWIEKQKDQDLIGRASQLANEIEELYGARGRAQRIRSIREKISASGQFPELTRLFSDATAEPLAEAGKYARVLSAARRYIESGAGPDAKLLLLNLQSELETEFIVAVTNIISNPSSALTRLQYLEITASLLEAIYAAGFISAHELEALENELPPVERGSSISVSHYQKLVRYAGFVPQWSYDAVKYAFAEPYARYTALDSRAARFIDDLLRGSAIALLSDVLRTLTGDVLNISGVSRSFFGRAESGLLGLNPGLARGRLKIVSEDELHSGASISRSDIVVVPQTVAELSPVAGILTRGEGNLLSHVQLLARNFGIPNVAIAQGLTERLHEYQGKEIFLLVASNGSILIDTVDRMPGAATDSPDEHKLKVPPPRLDVREPIILPELGKVLSGKVVGPKAANLGELNKSFPGKVAPAIALPFGIFLQHIDQGEHSIRKRLVSVYRRHQDRALGDAELAAELARLREEISRLQVSEELRKQLAVLMREQFGEAGSYGIFIRSDTNVEDLPGFTGAGLSETVANVVGFDQQMAAIPRVWASVLSERALAWRSRLLEQPEEVYASVLLMKSVNSDKSGVMVTTDLWSRTEGLTVATAWGVGGAVGGESAETLVLLPDARERLLSTAKSPYKRVIDPRGGIRWQAANHGPVLTAAEKMQLRQLAAEVAARYATVMDDDGKPMPWDIEYGFIDGQLTLFQIRPLVEKGQTRADRMARRILGERGQTKEFVSLDESISGL